jgi:hypothetical protein
VSPGADKKGEREKKDPSPKFEKKDPSPKNDERVFKKTDKKV